MNAERPEIPPTDLSVAAPSSDDDGNDGPWVFIGLDGEMSSADLDRGGRLIQAGAAAWTSEPGGQLATFASTIRHDEMDWSERAAQVHGLTRDDVAAAPPPDVVDDALHDWLIDHGATAGRRLVVAIGFNVGSFDLPFFRQALPRSSALLSRRTVDLNAVCFTYGGWDPNPANAARDFAGWKRSLKHAANTELSRRGMTVAEHDAGFDAAQALVGWWWLRSQPATATENLARMSARLDAVDPVAAVLGDGLLARLDGVPAEIVAAIVAARGADRSVRRWFGTVHPALGVTPLAALQAGRYADVVAIGTTPGSIS